jgi:DNA-binding transcriptional ArsR family regulator
MTVADPDSAVAPIAAAIGEPTRARMLYCLVDGRARTSTELAVVADVTPSTASVHLQRLKGQKLVKVLAQGKHRYYSLARPEVATALEALHVLTDGDGSPFSPRTPHRLREARTCYDHIAGTLGVRLFERFRSLDWIVVDGDSTNCDLTAAGRIMFERLGIDVQDLLGLRRKFAFACLDWSERRPHLGGALAAAILRAFIGRRWVTRELDSRILRVTSEGRRELQHRLGVTIPQEKR